MPRAKKDDELPLTKEELKFCDAMFHLRDLKKAAISIGKHPDGDQAPRGPGGNRERQKPH